MSKLHRLRILRDVSAAIGSMSIAIGFMSINLGGSVLGPAPYVLGLGVVLLLIAVSIWVYIYLQSNSLMSYLDIEYVNKNVEKLKSEIDRIEGKYASDLKGRIDSITSDAVMLEINDKFHDKQIEKFKLDFTLQQVKSAKANIENRIASKSRSGNIQLSLGFGTTLIAVIFLFWSVLGNDDSNTKISEYAMSHDGSGVPISLFLIKFLPRLSVSIFIELFSFFFLSMYRKGNEEIQYLTNEKTNIEMKVLALQTAIMSNRQDALDKVIAELSTTERNFVLKKGESTVEIEKSRLESNAVKDTLKGVGSILNGSKN